MLKGILSTNNEFVSIYYYSVVNIIEADLVEGSLKQLVHGDIINTRVSITQQWLIFRLFVANVKGSTTSCKLQLHSNKVNSV